MDISRKPASIPQSIIRGDETTMRTSITAFLSGVLLGPGLPATALANGATASFPAGGVVFHEEQHISIEREDLEIGLERIRVRYVFRSSAPGPLRLTIGFPMAKVALEDGPDNLGDRSAATDDPRNYMAFHVSANGKAVKPKLHEYAWVGDTNITARLQALHVPVFSDYNGRDFGLQNLPKSTLKTLTEAAFVTRYGKDPTVYPQWRYQSVYEWRQSFPPGRSTVEIDYVPMYGDVTTEAKYSLFPGEGDDRYCYDAAFKARFKDLRARGVYTEPLTLGYILRTARNWNGPIGHFRLKIVNPDHYQFSFCPPTGLKLAGDGATWEAETFTPDRDIDLVFFSQ